MNLDPDSADDGGRLVTDGLRFLVQVLLTTALYSVDSEHWQCGVLISQCSLTAQH